MRLDAERWAPFWSALVHMIRNAIDHGIEEARERAAVGKPTTSQIRFLMKRVEKQAIVEIGDDGHGIDWEAVRNKAKELGFDVGTDEQLSELLCHGGISTKNAVTEYSGRGVGVSACYDVCRAMGGELTVSSVKGQGTTARFAIPSGDEALRREVS